MPTELSVNSICSIVSEEKFGFRFGKPDRPSESSLACILPILRETSQERQYITYPETEEVLATDSGSIDKVNLKNTSKKNVFVRSGTIFAGKGTQSRALTRSAVLFPGQSVALDVRCVHASHGIRPGSGFEYGGITPLAMDSAFYTAGYRAADQRTMWNNVHSYAFSISHLSQDEEREPISGGLRERVQTPPRRPTAPRMGKSTRTPIRASDSRIQRAGAAFVTDSAAYGQSIPTGIGSDDLRKNFDAFAASFDDILSKARLHDNQVGLGLITEKGCRTIELFDLDKSWEAIHKDSVKRMGTELLTGPDKANVFEYKPEHAINAVRAVLALPYKTNLVYEHKPSNGEPAVAIFGLTAQRYVGEAVELDGRVIHLVLLEMA